MKRDSVSNNSRTSLDLPLSQETRQKSAVVSTTGMPTGRRIGAASTLVLN